MAMKESQGIADIRMYQVQWRFLPANPRPLQVDGRTQNGMFIASTIGEKADDFTPDHIGVIVGCNSLFREFSISNYAGAPFR